jgi:hypothetical protein
MTDTPTPTPEEFIAHVHPVPPGPVDQVHQSQALLDLQTILRQVADGQLVC